MRFLTISLNSLYFISHIYTPERLYSFCLFSNCVCLFVCLSVCLSVNFFSVKDFSKIFDRKKSIEDRINTQVIFRLKVPDNLVNKT